MNAIGTYVYCLVADSRRPRAPRSRTGPHGLGPVRLLLVAPAKREAAPGRRGHAELGLWAAVADAPVDIYGERAINLGLKDLDWVSRAAIAHEAVVESFVASPAVLPMKLFTIFTSDERALAHLQRERAQMQAAVTRVRGHHEWGIRVVLDRARAVSSAAPPRANRGSSRVAAGSGAGYLQRKKAHHDATARLAERSHEIVADLYERLAGEATEATRRSARDLAPAGAPLLLDAAYLVPKTRTRTFQSAVSRQARTLIPQGYVVTLTGPWPPYTFMQGE